MQRIGLLRRSVTLLGATLLLASVLGVPQDPTVFITRTGEKYHQDGCRHLRSSKIPVKLSEAKKMGKVACKVCF